MVSRITGSVGKGLAAITMDKEFQQKRREEMNRAPKDFGESLAKGGKGLLKVATLPASLTLRSADLAASLTHSLTSCSSVCRVLWAESRVSSPSLWRVSKLRPHCPLIWGGEPPVWVDVFTSVQTQSAGVTTAAS